MENVTIFLGDYKHISVIVHVLAVIVGMGAALTTDILFNVFIKDKKINIHENRTLNTLSDIVWGSLFFILLSGIVIFFSDAEKYMNSVKFLVKITVVCFIIINGYLFQKVVHPALKKINFTDRNLNHKYVKVRKLSFAFGAISLLSWLSAFILGMLTSIPLSYFEGVSLYIFICIGGIIASQIVENRLTRPKN